MTATGPPGSAARRLAVLPPRNLFVEQARNRRLTWVLIAVFVLFLAFLGLGFDLFVLGAAPVGGPIPAPIGATVASLVGGASAFLGYRFGDRAVLAASGARPVAPGDPNARVLMNVVTEMAIASGLPMPRVYLIDDPDPNAFATGRDPEHASIAVTRGLLETMTREELQGVIAHEMSHVRNYDIRTMMIVAAVLGAVLLLSQWGARIRFGGGRRGGGRDGLSGPVALALLVVWVLAILLAPLLGRLLATAVSRRREFLADASGAELTRNPLGLASALRKLEAATAPTRRIHRGTAHLCIVDPLALGVNEREGRVADLFATHPPIHERIARLEAMAYQGTSERAGRHPHAPGGYPPPDGGRA